LVRASIVLTEAGVSQRDIPFCLGTLWGTSMSPSWVNAELAKAEAAAASINRQWQPAIAELLSADEIYSNGSPNLLMVGTDSLYIYALTRQPDCDGETWACLLFDMPECPQVASDAGKGLRAGAEMAGMKGHQLDWDHLLRPLWGQAARLEEQAYAALQEVEDRRRKFLQARGDKRLENHLATLERLQVAAQERVDRYDRFEQIARQVDGQFALIDLETGQLRDPVAGAECLRRQGQQLQSWSGTICQKLGTYLTNLAEGLFRYQPVLAQALAPLIERWGAHAIQALSRIWQVEADEKRHPLPLPQRQLRQRWWEDSLDQAVALLGAEHLSEAWDAVCEELGRCWRGSMLSECVNSLLRPHLDRRKHTDQGCLELLRFLHNTHLFQRGKRAGHSPAELAGLDVPDDPLTLLGLAPQVPI